MADVTPGSLIARQEALASERSIWESHWQELAELARPMRAEFTTKQPEGSKRTQKIYDSTAGVAADVLASGLWGMATNGGTEWFDLRHPIADLNQVTEVAQWLADCTSKMRQVFNAHGGQFFAQADENIADLVTFGTAVFFEEERIGQGRISFRCRHLTECYVAENDDGEVDTVFRRFEWTARQAYQKWGDKLPLAMRTAAEKQPEHKFPFLHCVMPREDYAPRERFSKRGRPFASYYVSIEGALLLDEGGYYELPYQVARWSKASRGVYGDSPAMLALPDVKMVNSMSKTTIIGAQKQVDPPILAPDEGVVRGLRTAPGQPIYGAVDSQGRPLVHPFQTGGNPGLGLELEQQRRNAIKEAFYWSLMTMAGPPYRTATEVLIQQEEKMRVMGPQLSRLVSEFLDPLIERTFKLMFRANAFAPPPPVMAQYPGVSIEYVSPLARAQKAQRGAATVRTMQAIQPMAVLDQSVMDNFDLDFIARDLADALGMPPRGLRDPREVAKIRAQRQQQQMAAMLAANAKPIASALKDATAANGMAMEQMQPQGGTPPAGGAQQPAAPAQAAA